MPSSPFEYEEKPRSPLARAGLVAAIVLVLGVGAMFVRQLMSGGQSAPRRAPEMVMIKPLAPPPPPPPPPPPQAVPRPQVEEQTTVTEQDLKQEETPPADPSPSLGTGVSGNGPPDGFGLGGRDRGMIAGTGAGGVKGSRFGGYFTQVVQAVTGALGRHDATRHASFDIRLKLWTDRTGRVTRVRLLQSTGDDSVDRALQADALVGCQLPDLPADLRLPLELRVNLRRPN